MLINYLNNHYSSVKLNDFEQFVIGNFTLKQLLEARNLCKLAPAESNNSIGNDPDSKLLSKLMFTKRFEPSKSSVGIGPVRLFEFKYNA